MQSLFRRLTHEALETVTFQGEVVDLGGSKTSEYLKMVQKTASSVTVLNLDTQTLPDIFADLEQPLPCANQSFDTVLAMNVLEHIYHYKQLLQEAYRILRPKGQMVIVVPFLFQIHPSPNDFFRYTRETLPRILAEEGFKAIEVQEIGTGVWAACYQLFHNFLPGFLVSPLQWMACKLDGIFSFIARKMNKKYVAAYYPLGYLVRAWKE